MTLVFAHSWGSSAREWDRLAPLLKGYDLIIRDLPGFGDAPPSTPDPTVATLADDIERMTDGLTEYVLVGHSMGGKGAMALAARRPERLKRLILLAPSPLGPEPMSDEDRAETLAGYGDRSFAEATVAKITGSELPEPYRTRADEDYLRTSESAWRGWMEVGSREDLSPLYADVTLPTLILAGERDPVIAPDFAREEILPRLPDASLRVIEGSGHLSPLEKPGAIAEVILTFLAQ